MKKSISVKWKSLAVMILTVLLCVIMCISFAACGSEAPYIGDDGYWYVNGEKTDYPATGPQGPEGPQGPQGEPGEDYTPGQEPDDDVDLPDISEQTISPVGSTTGHLENEGKFYLDYETVEEEQRAARDHNIKLGEEGFVLLKNENDALPMVNEKDVTLLGVNSYQMIYSTIGSGAGSTGSNGYEVTTLQQSMERAGFNVNQRVMSMYALQRSLSSDEHMLELDMSYYTPAITSTYNGYGDAAIVTLSRIGSEGGDILAHDAPGHSDPDDHALQLQDNEEALIRHAKANFDKVIVLINSSNILQIPELAEEKTEDNLGVDAILWIGNPGNDAQDAIGRILNGEVNPSGKTVEVWENDFTKGPTWTNFASNEQNKNSDGTRMDAFYYNEEGEDTGYRTVEYREGIYMGYRYYETLYADAAEADKEEAYSNVLYPFGYGLSYTTFDWELSTDIPETAEITAANQTVTVRIKVTNTGDVAGKDVVQIYSNPPYTEGGIEKAAANLVGFAKTDMLEPGQSQTVQVRFAAQDLASFDFSDANDNGETTYELEAGDYIISANRDSHTPVVSVTRTVDETIICDTDLHTGAEIKPVFVDNGGTFDYSTVNASLEANMISRATGLKQPAPVSKDERTLDNDTIEYEYDYYETYRSYQDSPDDPWYVSAVPTGWTQAASHEADGSDVTIKIREMAGVDYTAPTIEDGVVTLATDPDSQKWDTFMNQLTWEDLWSLVQYGGGSEAVPEAGVEHHNSPEGSIQMNGGTLWPCAPIMAATFNTELARKTGELIGNEALFKGTTHWNGPGMNIHRSPLGGRNYEYYSQDGVHSARIAEAIVGGVASKGLTCYAKHMFLNDQETYRNIGGGVFTWATEQTIREIYAKPFEAIAKEGHTTGYMSAFNRLGEINCAINNALHYDLSRDEWGFKGIYMTDAWIGSWVPLDLAARAGDDHPLGTGTEFPHVDLELGEWDVEQNCVLVDDGNDTNGTDPTLLSPTHYVSVRKAAQRILWVYANTSANKNGLVASAPAKLTFDLNCYNAKSAVVPGLDVSSFSVADGSEMPAGLELSSSGLVSGTPTEEGTFSVDIIVVADGYVQVNADLEITVVNAIYNSGSDLTALTMGTAMDTTFSTDYYAYGNDIPGGNRTIVDWYQQNADDTHGVIGLPDLTAPDIPHIADPDNYDEELSHRYGYSYKVESGSTTESLPAGLSFSNVMGTVIGKDGVTEVDCIDGYRLSGTPTESGTWTITITLNVPHVQGGRFVCATWAAPCAELQYTRTVTITIA